MKRTAAEGARYASGKTYEEFASDGQMQRVVERCIEIVGEAAGQLSKSLTDAHPEVEWRAIIAQRHILAHEYGRVEARRTWRVATVRLPELVEAIERIILAGESRPRAVPPPRAG